MDQTDIFTRTQQIDATIKSVLTPDQFVLNSIIGDLYEEKRKLQEECEKAGHKYDELGLCIFCKKQDPNHTFEEDE